MKVKIMHVGRGFTELRIHRRTAAGEGERVWGPARARPGKAFIREHTPGPYVCIYTVAADLGPVTVSAVRTRDKEVLDADTIKSPVLGHRHTLNYDVDGGE